MKKSFVLAAVSAICLSGATALKSDAAPRVNLKDISFDGYCDGMSLVVDIQPKVSNAISGNRTGCVSDVVGGVKVSKISDLQGPGPVKVAVTSDSGVPTQFTFYIFSNHTWVIYGATGGGTPPFFVNSGTWSDGAPTLAAKRLKSSTTKK